MNHGEGWGSGGRRFSRGRGQPPGKWVVRNNGEIQNKGEQSLYESSGNKSRGSRGRGRSTTSFSPRNSSGHVNDGKVYVKKQDSVEEVIPEDKGVLQQGKFHQDEIDFTKRRPAVVKSRVDEDLLQSSSSSSSKKSGGSSISRECEESGVRTSRDLFIQIEDVGLSCQESAFSTSGKAEVYSIEVCNSAQKSGGKGDSSNEGGTRPSFDLFLKKRQGLKPSLLELAREKKKAAEGYTGVFIRPGMVLLKNYLSINDQVMIVNKCRELGLGEGGFYQPGYEDGAVLRLKMMCLGKNWDPQTSQYGEIRPVDGSIPPKIPFEFSQLVGKAIKESQSVVATNSKRMKEDGVPDMSPDVCIVNFYSSTGKLGLHQDKDESKTSIRKGLPVVSFSIGDSAEFLYGDHRDADKADMVVLESGDVLLFGGKSRNVFHGVRSILKDTAPKVLIHETSLRPGRLNLTFRQY